MGDKRFGGGGGGELSPGGAIACRVDRKAACLGVKSIGTDGIRDVPGIRSARRRGIGIALRRGSTVFRPASARCMCVALCGNRLGTELEGASWCHGDRGSLGARDTSFGVGLIAMDTPAVRCPRHSASDRVDVPAAAAGVPGTSDVDVRARWACLGVNGAAGVPGTSDADIRARWACFGVRGADALEEVGLRKLLSRGGGFRFLVFFDALMAGNIGGRSVSESDDSTSLEGHGSLSSSYTQEPEKHRM